MYEKELQRLKEEKEAWDAEKKKSIKLDSSEFYAHAMDYVELAQFGVKKGIPEEEMKGQSPSQIKERIKELQPRATNSSDPLNLRLKTAYQQINNSKVWSDPKKRQKLEKLLSQLEALTSAE